MSTKTMMKQNIKSTSNMKPQTTTVNGTSGTHGMIASKIPGTKKGKVPGMTTINGGKIHGTTITEILGNGTPATMIRGTNLPNHGDPTTHSQA